MTNLLTHASTFRLAWVFKMSEVRFFMQERGCRYMQTFILEQEFTDIHTEQGVIAAIAITPRLYEELRDLLRDGLFCQEVGAWDSLSSAIRDGRTAPKFDWEPVANVEASMKHLADLYVRRVVAKTIEEVAGQLYRAEASVDDLVLKLHTSLAQAIRTVKKNDGGKLTWATGLLADVVGDAERWDQQRKETGKQVLGLPTGFPALDEILGGLDKGLYIVAGAPGMGKSSFALQLSTETARVRPVIYVTFENPAKNLILKAICARAGIDTQQVRRGLADLEHLRKTAMEWGMDVAPRLAFIEGVAQLSVASLRSQVSDAMLRHNTDTCFIVVDYLQQWAKSAVSFRGLDSARSRVDALSTELRELAITLNSPLLAISSQNRQGGDYGDGAGRAALDSFKESGDIEYVCDVAMFLVPSGKPPLGPNARSLKLIISKNRDGDTGTIDIAFRPDLSSFHQDSRNV
jgi:replicative DNA helicase